MGSTAASRSWAVVVAAGRGERFGRPKHDLTIDGDALWRIAHDLFADLGIRVTIVGDVDGGVPGGERRRDSVAAGLATVDDAEFVLVHDAARPLASVRLVESVLERLAVGDVDGVIPALAVTDTIKRVGAGARIVETVDRSALVTVQTPQGFRTETLRAAHGANTDVDATDDAALVERIGGVVVTVPGEPTNLKVTYPEDLERVRLIAHGRGAP